MNKPSVAVIGSGYWGKILSHYHELGVLKLICDKNETVLAGFKKQYPGVDTCLALARCPLAKDIDGVVIATPAETHYTLARQPSLRTSTFY